MTSSPLAGVLADVGRSLELQWAAEEQRDLELTEAERWARDPLGWLDSGHVWIASKFDRDGREQPKVRPVRLRLYPTQVETLSDWLDLDHLRASGELRFRNFAAEKSRQIGETWLFAATVAWILHHHAAAGGVMHRKSAEIDDGGERSTWRSLFGKVRFVDRHLPRDRLPGLGRLAFRPFSREPAKVENAANGSVVYGEGQTDDPFRGMTLDYLLVDEAAFVEHGEAVYAAIDEACPNGKALVSTVNGDGNVHARICDERPAGWRIRRLHWSQHPVYREGLHVAGEHAGCALCEGNRQGVRWDPREPRAHRYTGRLVSPWYDQRVVGKTDEQVANELDIDRARALAGRVFAEFSDEAHVVPGGLPYEEGLHARLELGWDFGLDVTSVVVCQDAPNEYRVLGLFEAGDLLHTTATPERVADGLVAYLAELGVPARLLTRDWTRRIHCVGDPSGQHRSLESGQVFVNAYRRLGWLIGRPAWRYCRTTSPSIASVKRLLVGSPKPLRVCGVNGAEFVSHMRNNVWPTDMNGRRRLGSTQPLDDIHNHSMRAFAYLMVSKWPPPMTDTDEEPPPLVESVEPDETGSFPSREERAAARRYEEAGVIDRGLRGSL